LNIVDPLSDPRALAEWLWRLGLGRRSEQLGARRLVPDFEPRAVSFAVELPGGNARFRVEPTRPGPSLRAGPVLQVTALDPGPDPRVLDRLADWLVTLTPTLAFPAAPPAPARRLELFLVDGCTLSCSFCCESTRIRRHTRMPWEQAERRLRQAAREGVATVQFMGGEASLHPDFPRALRLAKELGMGTYTITNLLRWEDRAFAEEVAPSLDEIMISMHAWGRDAGEVVTGRATWWDRFRRAARNARRTLRARVKASTVLSRHDVDHLEDIAGLLLDFQPTMWVMGNPVPVAAARADAVDTGLRLAEQEALRPRLTALRERCASRGCRLVFFCIPHCVLGPGLWDASHDQVVDNQDLSDNAPADAASTFFWSQADFLDSPRPVTLARTRPSACAGCSRRDRCGGYFGDYVARHGDHELHAVP